jgi:DNA (cytosine-5)-methyltransferase 1
MPKNAKRAAMANRLARRKAEGKQRRTIDRLAMELLIDKVVRPDMNVGLLKKPQQKRLSSGVHEAPPRKQSRTRRPVAFDLFSGCGGLTLGLKQAGFRVVGAIDVDPLSAETYKANHRDVKVWQDDIRNLEPSQLLEELGLKEGKLDLLAGCPPCQGFSTMRTLNGAVRVDDPRNDLLLEFHRFVKVIRPRTIMMENVPGLADDEMFKTFCRRMKKLGYVGNHRILNAAQFGVPQRRRRLIYLAGLGLRIPFARPIRGLRTVADAIQGLPKPGKSGDPLHDMPEHRTPGIMKIIRRIPKNGGSRLDIPEEFQLACHKRCNGFKDVYGRMAWWDVAPTITSGCFNPSKGRFLHPQEDRAITMREAALLQGFPPRYKFPVTGNKSAVASMIGNALPPPFIAAHAKIIYEALAAWK